MAKNKSIKSFCPSAGRHFKIEEGKFLPLEESARQAQQEKVYQNDQFVKVSYSIGDRESKDIGVVQIVDREKQLDKEKAPAPTQAQEAPASTQATAPAPEAQAPAGEQTTQGSEVVFEGAVDPQSSCCCCGVWQFLLQNCSFFR